MSATRSTCLRSPRLGGAAACLVLAPLDLSAAAGAQDPRLETYSASAGLRRGAWTVEARSRKRCQRRRSDGRLYARFRVAGKSQHLQRKISRRCGSASADTSRGPRRIDRRRPGGEPSGSCNQAARCQNKARLVTEPARPGTRRGFFGSTDYPEAPARGEGRVSPHGQQRHRFAIHQSCFEQPRGPIDLKFRGADRAIGR